MLVLFLLARFPRLTLSLASSLRVVDDGFNDSSTASRQPSYNDFHGGNASVEAFLCYNPLLAIATRRTSVPKELDKEATSSFAQILYIESTKCERRCTYLVVAVCYVSIHRT